jgi:hypothetical protein
VPAGYKNLTLRLDLSEEWGDGCFVELRNPDMLPLRVDPYALVLPPRPTPEGREPSPEELDAWRAAYETMLIEAGKARASELVLRWCVWDPETGIELPLPKDDPTVFAKLPAGIMAAIGRKLTEPRPTNPRTPPSPASTTSTTS